MRRRQERLERSGNQTYAAMRLHCGPIKFTLFDVAIWLVSPARWANDNRTGSTSKMIAESALCLVRHVRGEGNSPIEILSERRAGCS